MASMACIAALGRAVRQIVTPGSHCQGLGLSFLSGIAAVALLGGAFAFAGLPPVPFVATAALLSAVVHLRGRPALPRPDVRDAAFALPVAMALVVLLALCWGPMPGGYDALANWVYKARALTGADVHSPLWHGPLGAQHPEYPLGLPALDALVLAATRSHPWLWLRVLQVTMLAALAALVWQSLGGCQSWRVRRSRWAVPLGLAVAVALLLPRMRANLVLANADLPVAVMAAAGVLRYAHRLLGTAPQRALVIEGTLLLGGAAAIKQEGVIVLVAALVSLGWMLRTGLPRLIGRWGVALLGIAAFPYATNALGGTRNSDYSLHQSIATIARKLAQGSEVMAGDLATDTALTGTLALVAIAFMRHRGDPDLRRSLALPLGVVACELALVALGYGLARGGARSLAEHSFDRVLLTPMLVTLFAALPIALMGAIAPGPEAGT